MASVRDFGARGDGSTDDTSAILHAVERGDGLVTFPRGDYLISKPLFVPLEKHGRIGLAGEGGTARLIMKGPGPAVHLLGTHGGTALPASVADEVWRKQRTPTVQGLEIVGAHPEADGIRVDGAMQPTILGVAVRRCRHGIHLLNRDRNVLIADCHIYDNSGVGIFFDRVNLHQTNVHGSHISYCRQGGIRIVGSEIRNLQICSNDIEYNFDPDAPASADVLFDCREGGTVREGTIVGNNIQARQSPHGANVRLLGVGKGHTTATGLFTISGNLIGSQETAVHLSGCRGVVVSGCCIYSGYQRALWLEDCEHVVVSGNSIDHNPDYRAASTDQVVLTGCRNVNVSGIILQHTRPAEQEVEASMEVSGCENVNVTGCQIHGARRRGIRVRESRVLRVSDCTIRPAAGDKGYQAAVDVEDGCRQVMVVNSFLGRGSKGDVLLPGESGTAAGNVTL